MEISRRRREYFMNGFYSACVEKHSFCEGSFPRINVGADSYIAQLCESFTVGSWKSRANLLLWDDVALGTVRRLFLGGSCSAGLPSDEQWIQNISRMYWR